MALATNVLQQIAAGNGQLESLASTLASDKRSVVKAVQVLKRRGLVQVHGAFDSAFGGLARGSYALTPAGTEWARAGLAVSPGQGARPRQRTSGLRERAWWHFRAHRIATLKEILTTHAEGGERAAPINLYKYLMALQRAGVLRRSPQRVATRQSRGQVQWSLARDLGPKAPVWRQLARVVYDPNSGQTLAIEEVGDE